MVAMNDSIHIDRSRMKILLYDIGRILMQGAVRLYRTASVWWSHGVTPLLQEGVRSKDEENRIASTRSR